MNSILITGCNRGLGFGLVKCLANCSRAPNYIFATYRNIENSAELQHLTKKHSNIHLIKIDVTDEKNYANVVKEVENIVKDNGLNVLFNNAGMAPRSTRLPFVKSQELIDSFITNTVSPIMLTKAFLPLLKKAAEKNSDLPMGFKKAGIINMSSMLGSITSNTEGGIYAYRVTKAGLNAATKSMSIDLKRSNIMCVCLHPGWVKTDMGGSKAPMDVESSCKQILDTIFSLNESDNGTFVQFHGESQLPW